MSIFRGGSANAGSPQVSFSPGRFVRGRSSGSRLAIAFWTLVVSSNPVHAAEALFVEAAEDVGLSFVHQPLGDTPGQVQHGGGAVGDFNNDGWPDLFVVGGGDGFDHLFINDGDGTFTERASEWGLATDLYRGNGAAAGDYDNDGWIDLFVTSLGPRGEFARNGDHRLYRNNGDGTFSNVAEEAGLEENQLFPDGYSPVWGDYDLDGDLDLLICGWELVPNTDLAPGTRLFRNLGDGTFRDVSQESGILDFGVRGLSAVFADMDGDRYPELLVAGDFGTSRYFANRRDGTFTGINPLRPGRDGAYNGMGSAVADFDRDGDPDWFVTSIYPAWDSAGPPGNRLYVNASRGVGDHRLKTLPESGGVNDGGWAWGTVAIDFDHDGWSDILQTNGWRHDCEDPNQNPNFPECYEDEATYLFRNRGDGRFVDVAQRIGLDHQLQGLAVVQFDPDRDGDMDVAIFTNGDRLYFFRNDVSGPGHNWLQVRLDTSAVSALAPQGIGSKVTVESGGKRQVGFLTGGSNYLSTSEAVLHFGLRSVETLDRVVVDWPDGGRTVLEDVAANNDLTIDALSRRFPATTDARLRGDADPNPH